MVSLSFQYILFIIIIIASFCEQKSHSMFSTSNTFIQFMYIHVNVNYGFCMVSSFTVLDMLDVMSWFGVVLSVVLIKA